MGSDIDEEDAWDFLYNYEKHQKQLPPDEEIQTIALEYVKMHDTGSIMEEDAVFIEDPVANNSEPVIEAYVDEGIQTTPTEAAAA